jgi:hypothetical protein
MCASYTSTVKQSRERDLFILTDCILAMSLFVCLTERGIPCLTTQTKMLIYTLRNALGRDSTTTCRSTLLSGGLSCELATEPPRELVERSRHALASVDCTPLPTGSRTICFPTLFRGHLPSFDGRYPLWVVPAVPKVVSELPSRS